MDYSVDTAIIGAGPAGISCAITLEKANVSNCVIDKKAFPRKKTCGGLVTNKTLQVIMSLLDVDDVAKIKDIFCDKCNTVSLFNQITELSVTETTHMFYFVDRTFFDNYLVDYYKKINGTLLDGTGPYTIDYAHQTISFLNGDKIFYKTLIAADGALSKTRNDLGLKMDKKGFCIETHIPKDECAFTHHIGVHFGVVGNGYAWVFPAGDSYCIGLGNVYSNKINYQEKLKGFLQDLGISRSYQFMGAYIPYGEVVDTHTLPDGIVLVGDAAGLVDPIYGEGLYFALSSGVEAAKSILENSTSIRESFDRRIKPYVRIIEQGTRLQKFFFHSAFQSIFLRAIRGRNNFLKYYCDKQISEYSYAYSNILRLLTDYVKEGRCKNVDP